MSADELRVICDTVVRLTELRMRECPQLCVENFAPELLAKMVGASKSDIYFTPEDPRWQAL